MAARIVECRFGIENNHKKTVADPGRYGSTDFRYFHTVSPSVTNGKRRRLAPMPGGHTAGHGIRRNFPGTRESTLVASNPELEWTQTRVRFRTLCISNLRVLSESLSIVSSLRSNQCGQSKSICRPTGVEKTLVWYMVYRVRYLEATISRRLRRCLR